MSSPRKTSPKEPDLTDLAGVLIRRLTGFLWRRDLLLIALALCAGVGIGIAYKNKNEVTVESKVLCSWEYDGQFYIPKLEEN